MILSFFFFIPRNSFYSTATAGLNSKVILFNSLSVYFLGDWSYIVGGPTRETPAVFLLKNHGLDRISPVTGPKSVPPKK